MKKTIYLAVFLGIVAALAGAALSFVNDLTEPLIAAQGPTGVDVTTLADGTYTGSGKGFGGDVTATVEVSGGAITSVTLAGDAETPAIGGAALPELEQAFVDAQSIEIDAVSGATYTTNGAIEAVSNALSGEQGTSGSTSAPAASEEPEATAEAQPAQPTIDLTTIPDGTYTGSAEGFSTDDPIEATVTVSGGVITEVVLTGKGETPEIGGAALATLQEEFLAQQSSAIDVVSGATYTSQGAMDAVLNALSSAQE